MLNKPSLITLKLQTDEPAVQSLPGVLGSQYSSAVSYIYIAIVITRHCLVSIMCQLHSAEINYILCIADRSIISF